MQYSNELSRKLAKSLEELSNEIVTDPERLAAFLQQWRGNFYSHSIGNMLLILSQKPDATLVAGGKQWQVRHGRRVVKGQWANRIHILAPIHEPITDEAGNPTGGRVLVGFTDAFVFDVSQTDGRPVKVGGGQFVSGKTTLKLQSIAKLFDWPLKVGGESQTGGTADGKVIRVAKSTEVGMQAVYFHELAHMMLHWKLEGDRATELPDTPTRELEAEAVSFLVCGAYGIKNEASALYIGHWKGDKAKMEQAGMRVLRTAEAIIRTIDKARKEVK